MRKTNNIVITAITAMAIACAVTLTSCAHKSGHRKRYVSAADQREQAAPGGTDADRPYTQERRVKGSTKVTMRKEGGVYLVPIKVNGLSLDFIFDTGASSISISSAEAVVMMRQGQISEDDIIGQQQFQDATGGISVGTVIRLRSVEIGGIELTNVEASVVDNIQAPLLLGQTALAKFGKVTIDYDNNTIEFN